MSAAPQGHSAVVAAGPARHRLFDDPVQPELLLGVTGELTEDPGEAASHRDGAVTVGIAGHVTLGHGPTPVLAHDLGGALPAPIEDHTRRSQQSPGRAERALSGSCRSRPAQRSSPGRTNFTSSSRAGEGDTPTASTGPIRLA